MIGPRAHASKVPGGTPRRMARRARTLSPVSRGRPRDLRTYGKRGFVGQNGDTRDQVPLLLVTTDSDKRRAVGHVHSVHWAPSFDAHA